MKGVRVAYHATISTNHYNTCIMGNPSTAVPPPPLPLPPLNENTLIYNLKTKIFIMATKPKGDVKAQKKRYRERHPEKRKSERARYKKAHPENNRACGRRVYTKARYEAILHYSSGSLRCSSCGESHYEFLEIDHINGGGKEQKREIGNSIYPWLRRNGYPGGYQVLCSNCNIKKVKIAAKERGEAGTPAQRKYYQRNQRERLRALTEYSTGTIKCDCCGIVDPDVLCLDHKNGDGAKHRKSLKKHEGSNISKWSRRNGYPDIFRVLCHNCNQSLGKYGYCPHHLPNRYEVQTHQHSLESPTESKYKNPNVLV